MTPKEKAIELIGKMEKDFQYFASREIAIKHALIAVDELIDQCWSYREIDLGMSLEYWQEVKQEIESYEL
jgi:hypothetical protein